MSTLSRVNKQQSSDTTEISPSIHDGFYHMRKEIIGGFVALTCMYYLLIYTLKDSETYLTPARQYCKEGDDNYPCARPDLFAFQIGSGLCIIYVGLKGFISWHITKTAHKQIPQTPEGRCYGYLRTNEEISAINFTFQTWDFFISMTIKEMGTPIMVLHHLTAALVGYFSLRYTYLHYYGVYFGGVGEFSSIFLVICDLDKFFPSSPGTLYNNIVQVCVPTFAITFTIYRVILWLKVSYRLLCDTYYILKEGIAEKMRPGKTYVLYFFVSANVSLSILQIYWFKLIIDILMMKMKEGGEDSDSNGSSSMGANQGIDYT